MIRKTALAVGIGAVVVLGAAGTAVAAQSEPAQATPTSSATSSPTSSSAAAPTMSPTRAPSGHGKRVNLDFPGEFAQWTTFDAKTTTSTVNDGIRGQVTAVSPTSITVKAAGGTSQTFAVDPNTRVRGAKGGSGGTGQIKIGDQAVVVGTGQSTFTATLIADRGTPRQHGRKHR
jgi:hypothetical protein